MHVLAPNNENILKNLERADSVLWKLFYDVFIQVKTSNSYTPSYQKTLEKKGNLDIGLKLDKNDLSKRDFFSKNWTTAFLKLCGTQRLVKLNTNRPTVGKTSLKKREVVTSQGKTSGFIHITSLSRKKVELAHSDQTKQEEGPQKMGHERKKNYLP